MVAGINNASNSPENKKKTTDVSWKPFTKKKREDPNFEMGPIKSNAKRNRQLEELEKRLKGY
tara:strand:- start:36 stop:221 length:186 start_codon:yes stop_codon:yes gene_type:complete